MSRRFNADLEGCRVLLRMSTGDVEGTVYGVPENSSRLSLIKVVIVDSGTPIAGTFHFYDRDIASCVVLDNTHRKKQVIGQDEDGPRLLRVRPLPPHLERLNASVNSCEFICHRIEGDHSSEEVVKKGLIELMGPPDTLPKFQRPLPSEFEVIDQVNDRFNKAMAAVRNARSISIGFEGPKVSRHRPVSVLAVATSTKVFIFDVMNLKEELFNCGLREVLESDDIEKVIHDCRHLSDCLYHQYKVDLNNVFDTMVADVVIYAHKKLDAGQMSYLPQFVRGVQNCLRGFLNLTQEQLKYTRSRQGQQEELVCMWDQRPLSLAQIDSLVKDTVFLAELARTCLRQLLLQFQQSVHFFLKLDRDANRQNLDCLTPDHILPASFKEALNSGIAVPGSRRQSDNYNYDRDCYREYGRCNRNNEDNRFYHRGQQRWQEDNRFQYQSQRRWHDNGYHRRGQGRGGYAELRGVRSQGDAVRGQCSGRVEIYGEADKVDDSLFLVAMRHHQDTYHDKEPGDANGFRITAALFCCFVVTRVHPEHVPLVVHGDELRRDPVEEFEIAKLAVAWSDAYLLKSQRWTTDKAVAAFARVPIVAVVRQARVAKEAKMTHQSAMDGVPRKTRVQKSARTKRLRPTTCSCSWGCPSQKSRKLQWLPWATIACCSWVLTEVRKNFRPLRLLKPLQEVQDFHEVTGELDPSKASMREHPSVQ